VSDVNENSYGSTDVCAVLSIKPRETLSSTYGHSAESQHTENPLILARVRSGICKSKVCTEHDSGAFSYFRLKFTKTITLTEKFIEHKVYAFISTQRFSQKVFILITIQRTTLEISACAHVGHLENGR
jgi:hypothetical protein